MFFKGLVIEAFSCKALPFTHRFVEALTTAPNLYQARFTTGSQEGVPKEKQLSEVQPEDCPMFKGTGFLLSSLQIFPEKRKYFKEFFKVFFKDFVVFAV